MNLVNSQIFFYFVVIYFSNLVYAGTSINLNFRLPGIGNGNTPKIKTFDGNRVKNNSILMVYYHELSVAVVEVGPKKLLLNCNVIEIYSPTDIDKAMGPLEDVTTPIPITFQEMVHLMEQCVELDQINRNYYIPIIDDKYGEENKNFTTRVEEAKAIINNQLVLLSGIIPGTKWCGTGDIAKDYHDLGEDALTDMCCRNHDLCPVKIRAYSKKYNLNNDSLYTKSHCTCDDIFYTCMKRQNTKAAQILGQIYFNLVKVPCVQDGKEGRYFRDAKRF